MATLKSTELRRADSTSKLLRSTVNEILHFGLLNRQAFRLCTLVVDSNEIGNPLYFMLQGFVSTGESVAISEIPLE